MSYEPPSPPANLPTEVVDTLNEAPPELLREVTRYTEALAEYKEREARLEEETDNTNVEGDPMTSQTTSRRRPRSRSRRSTTTAITTGNGVREIVSSQNTKGPVSPDK